MEFEVVPWPKIKRKEAHELSRLKITAKYRSRVDNDRQVPVMLRAINSDYEDKVLKLFIAVYHSSLNAYAGDTGKIMAATYPWSFDRFSTVALFGHGPNS